MAKQIYFVKNIFLNLKIFAVMYTPASFADYAFTWCCCKEAIYYINLDTLYESIYFSLN